MLMVMKCTLLMKQSLPSPHPESPNPDAETEAEGAEIAGPRCPERVGSRSGAEVVVMGIGRLPPSKLMELFFFFKEMQKEGLNHSFRITANFYF